MVILCSCCPHNQRKEQSMSRFKKQSHTIWFCEYHVVWCPKYRYWVLAGKVKEEVELCVRDQTQQMECEVVELNVQADHVHLVVLIPPKVRIVATLLPCVSLSPPAIQPSGDAMSSTAVKAAKTRTARDDCAIRFRMAAACAFNSGAVRTKCLREPSRTSQPAHAPETHRSRRGAGRRLPSVRLPPRHGTRIGRLGQQFPAGRLH